MRLHNRTTIARRVNLPTGGALLRAAHRIDFRSHRVRTESHDSLSQHLRHISIRIMRSVESVGEGTRISAEIEGDPTGIMKWLTPLTRPMMRRSIENDYQRLKTLLEADK